MECPISWQKVCVVHESLPFNPSIANALYLTRYAENAGSGTTDIIRLCREAGLKDPVYESDHGTFSITIYRPKESSTHVQGGNTQPGLSNQLSNQLTNQLTNLRKTLLLEFSKNPNLTIAELAKQTGFSETGINKSIAWLKENGYLKREGNNRQGRWIVLSGNDTPEQPPDQDS